MKKKDKKMRRRQNYAEYLQTKKASQKSFAQGGLCLDKKDPISL